MTSLEKAYIEYYNLYENISVQFFDGDLHGVLATREPIVIPKDELVSLEELDPIIKRIEKEEYIARLVKRVNDLINSLQSDFNRQLAGAVIDEQQLRRYEAKSRLADTSSELLQIEADLTGVTVDELITSIKEKSGVWKPTEEHAIVVIEGIRRRINIYIENEQYQVASKSISRFKKELPDFSFDRNFLEIFEEIEASFS